MGRWAGDARISVNFFFSLSHRTRTRAGSRSRSLARSLSPSLCSSLTRARLQLLPCPPRPNIPANTPAGVTCVSICIMACTFAFDLCELTFKRCCRRTQIQPPTGCRCTTTRRRHASPKRSRTCAPHHVPHESSTSRLAALPQSFMRSSTTRLQWKCWHRPPATFCQLKISARAPCARAASARIAAAPLCFPRLLSCATTPFLENVFLCF